MKAEWTDEDYIKCIRAITNNWNYSVYQYNPNAIDIKELGLPLRFADRCFWWSEYYFGRQRNIDFDGLLLRADGRRKAHKMFRSRDIKKFVDDQVGSLAGVIKNFPKIIDSYGVSDNIVSARKTMLDIEKFLIDQQSGAKIQQLLEKSGAYIETVNAQNTVSALQGQQSAVNYVESLEQAAVNIGKDFLYRNFWEEQYIDIAKNAYITGLGAAKVSVVNGYPLLDVFPAYEAICPPRANGDQHRSNPYGGRIRWLTVQEIIALYPELGEKIFKEIESYAYNPGQGVWEMYNVTYNAGSSVVWWSTQDGVPKVAVSDVQWASYSGKEGKPYEQTIRQGVLIGNKWLTQQGIVTNQTCDWKNPTHTNLDFLFVQPMSIFGQNMGIPETIYSYVNQIDAWQTKVNEWIAKAKGRTYVMFTKNLPEGVTSQSVISDLADDGLTVLEGVDVEEGDTTGNTLMKEVNMELPQSVIQLIGSIAQYRQMMADILNIPDPARGQIKGYQPLKNIEASVANSSKGTSTFTIPLNTYYLRLLQKGVDKFVTSKMDNPNIDYNLIVGDTAMVQITTTPDFGFSRFAMGLCFEDIADEQEKKEMEGMIFAYAQNSQQTGYTLGDLYTIRSMSTTSEIRSYLEYREAQIKKEKMEAEQRAAEAAQQQQMISANAMLEQTAMNAESSENKEAAKLQSKEAIEAAKLAQAQE